MALSGGDFLGDLLSLFEEASEEDTLKVCNFLEAHGPDSFKGNIGDLSRLPSQAGTRKHLLDLWNRWKASPECFDSASMAVALRTAALIRKKVEASQTIELVWTGPQTPFLPFRRTQQVLLDLIESAQKTIILVTFAAYKVPEITEALVRAAGRGVEITLILENVEASEGKVGFDAISALGKEVAHCSKVYIWPRDRRGQDSNGSFGSLHAKCALADGQTAFVSSANLTGYALNLNMELGVYMRGNHWASRTATHFRELIRAGVLELIL